jgi:hypothetical protein
MNVCFCPSCRSLILADFRYCPYCGAPAAKGPGLAEALSPFDKLGAKGLNASTQGGASLGDAPRAVAAARPSVFASVQESLDRLEADMDLIIEELEKEGRSTS